MPTPPHIDEILGGGLTSGRLKDRTFVQNMIRRDGGWETRKGFGQLGQWDTTIADPYVVGQPEWGYREHMGSAYIETGFGHEQIVTVLRGIVNVSSTIYRSQVLEVYFVSIYDLTVHARQEQLLMARTSEFNTDVFEMPDWHGSYATCWDQSFLREKHVREKNQAFFIEFGGRLYFGNSDLGLMCYLPTIFSRDQSNLGVHRWHAWIRGHLHHEWNDFFEECPYLVRVIASPGGGVAGRPTDTGQYLVEDSFPRPTAATTFRGRIVYVDHDRKTLWFSDVNRPSAVHVDNSLAVPSANPVTAVAELGGDIYAWTSEETFVYRPSNGFIVSAGRGPVPISDRVGCLGPAVVCKDPNGLIWVDKTGVHRTSGNMQVTTISDAINEFWDSYITNPITSFYTSQVDPNNALTFDQPATRLEFDEAGVNAVYHPGLDALLISVPKYRVALCLTDGEWSVWSFETVADRQGVDVVVSAKCNIENAWFMSNGPRLFMVGGLDSQVISNDCGKVPTSYAHSYYLLEYGRGGALDRGVWDEDYRMIHAQWALGDSHGENPFGGYIYIGEPIALNGGYALPNGQTVDGDYRTFLLPIFMCPWEADGPVGVTSFSIEFTFDNAEWAFILSGLGANEINFLLPPERWWSREGYNPTAPVAGGQVTVVGNAVTIEWDRLNVPLGGNWTLQGVGMNILPRAMNPLMYLPIRELDPTHTTYDMGINPNAVAVVTGAGLVGMDTWVYQLHKLGDEDRRADDSVAQGVDWVYKPGVIEHRGMNTLLRDVRAVISTHGKGEPAVELAWPWRVLNATFGTDYKTWVAQIIDHTAGDHPAVQLVLDKSRLRARVYDSGNMYKREWDSLHCLWGDVADPTVGTVLVGDEPCQEVSFAEAIQGGWITVALHGTMLAHAEWLRLESVEVQHIGMGRRLRLGSPTADELATSLYDKFVF